MVERDRQYGGWDYRIGLGLNIVGLLSQGIVVRNWEGSC